MYGDRRAAADWRCGAVGGEVDGEGCGGQGGVVATRGEADCEEWPRRVFVKSAGGWDAAGGRGSWKRWRDGCAQIDLREKTHPTGTDELDN
jgi:hypothetical protein